MFMLVVHQSSHQHNKQNYFFNTIVFYHSDLLRFCPKN